MQNKKDQPQPLTPRTQKQKLSEKVKVILRIRPFHQSEQPQQFISVQEKNTISINKPGLISYMKFSYVQNVDVKQDKGLSQKQIFQSVDEAVKSVFQGIDSTIFAYGQTGAGKTYTVMGNCPQNNSEFDSYKSSLCSPERGILPRALEMILQEQRKKKNSRITISFFEIYNEKIFDLLTSNIKCLEIREGKNGEISIPNLSAVEIINMKEVTNYLAEGIKNRVTSSTSANIKSSRSHSIFHIKYQKLVINSETNENEVVTANLRVVDLAGSQKFNIPYDIPQSQKEVRILELKSINGSLSKLGHCISALTVQARTHIPVRDSKLTRILSDSLIGSGKIRLIICVSPSVSASNQTSSTLQFADRVKKAVFDRPYLNHSVQKKKMIEYQEFEGVCRQLEMERQRRIELEGIIQSSKVTHGEIQLMRENQRLRQQVTTLKEQLKVYSNQSKIINSRIKGNQKQPLQTHIKKNTSHIEYEKPTISPRQLDLQKLHSNRMGAGMKLKSTQLIKPGQLRSCEVYKHSSKNIRYEICPLI